MKRYGNFRFTRRMVVFVCLLVVSVSVLMNAHIVYAQSNTQNSVLSIKTDTSSSGFRDNTLILSHNHDSSAPVYSFILESTNSIFRMINIHIKFIVVMFLRMILLVVI